jgi:hypothetical protein
MLYLKHISVQMTNFQTFDVHLGLYLHFINFLFEKLDSHPDFQTF